MSPDFMLVCISKIINILGNFWINSDPHVGYHQVSGDSADEGWRIQQFPSWTAYAMVVFSCRIFASVLQAHEKRMFSIVPILCFCLSYPHTFTLILIFSYKYIILMQKHKSCYAKNKKVTWKPVSGLYMCLSFPLFSFQKECHLCS